MDRLVDELKTIVSPDDAGDDCLLMNSKYTPINIDKKNFHEIASEPKNPGKRMLFVDGGNSVLFDSAGFCIGIIRVGGIVYRDNKRIERFMEEFYILVKEDEGRYIVKTDPATSFHGMVFDPDDASLRNGIEQCNITKIISIIRRFAELEYAAEHAGNTDYILLDGTLEARYIHESEYLEKLLLHGKTCALSKTCSLTTHKGAGITQKLLRLNDGLWYYYPIVINNNPLHQAELYFIKLHDKSSHVFRFEIQKGFKGGIGELFSMLSANSADPIFLGYPYGLIDIDQYLRVSDEESRMLQTKLTMKMGSLWNEFSKHLNSTNAHSVLDKIKF